MWPTWKWVMLLYIATGYTWQCDVMHSCFRLSFQCTELFDLYVPLLCTWPLFQNEPDCLGYPTEWYTVDVDGVEVANLTANAGQSKFTDPSNGFQSLAINHTNGSVTLSLPLNQTLPENAVTLNMTKYNTVPTNRSDVTGKMITEMVPWGTSALFSELEWPLCTRDLVFRII